MIRPPFIGTKVIDNISQEEVEPLIDRKVLFASRWQFRGGTDAADWDGLVASKIIPIYERLWTRCMASQILQPKIVYGYFSCEKSGNAIVVMHEGKPYRFEFSRERKMPHRCVADFFLDGFVAMQIATVGNGANREAADMFAKNQYSDTFYLKGLAAEAAEAVAKFGHRHIRRELGVPDDCGERFSPGYPAFPGLIFQRKIVALLGSMKIGVSLTKTCMLIPEQSTSALISVDPKACRFNPNI